MTMSTKTTKTTNATKTNKSFDDMYVVLHDTIANKNMVTAKLNECGYIANMHTKNHNDFVSTVVNDHYYQLPSGSRVLVNAKRNHMQLWLTDNDKQLLVDNNIITDNDVTTTTDNARHYKTDMKQFAFDTDTFNSIMNVFNSVYALRFNELTTNA